MSFYHQTIFDYDKQNLIGCPIDFQWNLGPVILLVNPEHWYFEMVGLFGFMAYQPL